MMVRGNVAWKSVGVVGSWVRRMVEVVGVVVGDEMETETERGSGVEERWWGERTAEMGIRMRSLTVAEDGVLV